MARPQKTGIDYFYFDCDFFNNRKVRKILKGCGTQGITILTCLLCNIYKQGYYMTWDGDESAFDISDMIGVSDGAVSELVKKALDAQFFSKRMFEKHKILTSEAIQEIYFDACKRRDVIKYDNRYLLISVNEYRNAVNVNINPKNEDGSTQSKGKESKEDESKEDGAPGNVFQNPFSEGFLSVWELWKTYKKKQHRFVYAGVESEQAAINQLVKLSEGNEKTAAEIIEQSMGNGWQGFFALKNKDHGNSKNGQPGTGKGKATSAELYEILAKRYG